MKRAFAFCLLTFAFLAAASFAQTAKPPKDFEIEYDKFRDRTQVTRKNSYIKASNAGDTPVAAIIFRPYMLFAGKELTGDTDEFYFTFRSISMLCRSYCFIRSHGLIVMADDKRIDLGEGDWRGSSGGESMMYRIPRKDLEAMNAAASVEFQLGIFEAKFAPNDRATIQTLLDLGTAKK